METYVARQPIFNKSKKIFGYELLFRDGMFNLFPDVDGDTATSRVLSSSFLLIGTEKITGGRRAF
ncbi:MAG: signal transduction protein, partial [Desulfobacterales bacterium]|nr:signal transduction protein [Desulfobacterales bacterium]